MVTSHPLSSLMRVPTCSLGGRQNPLVAFVDGVGWQEGDVLALAVTAVGSLFSPVQWCVELISCCVCGQLTTRAIGITVETVVFLLVAVMGAWREWKYCTPPPPPHTHTRARTHAHTRTYTHTHTHTHTHTPVSYTHLTLPTRSTV